MPCRDRRWWMALLVGAVLTPCAQADDAPPVESRHRIILPPKIGRGAATPSTSSGGWWIGTAGVAVALAVFGGVSVAAKRFGLGPKSSEVGLLKVVGKTSLSPKHTVYLLRAGDRVLIVGTGPQGSPTLLGEMPADEAGVSSPMMARGRAGVMV